MANLLRDAFIRAQARFAQFEVINLTADYNVFAGRLATRNQDTSDQIADRLNRAAVGLPEGISSYSIDNNCALEGTVQVALDCLHPVKA